LLIRPIILSFRHWLDQESLLSIEKRLNLRRNQSWKIRHS